MIRKLNYLNELDGIRVVAVLLVLYWHYFISIIDSNFSFEILEKLVDYSGISWSGVDLFFVLSGFLICRILISQRLEKKFLFNFYVRRIFRIFPPYFLLIFFYVAFKNWSIPTFVDNSNLNHPIYSYFLFIQNFWMSNFGFGPYFIGATWSLAIEEQFYLIVPIIILLIPKEKFLIICLVGIVSAPIFRYFTVSELGAFVLFPCRMDQLFFGALIASFESMGYLKNYNKQFKITIPILLFISVIILFLYKSSYGKIGDPLLHTLLAIVYSSFILLVVLFKPGGWMKFSNNFMVQHCARISYMIYLSHEVFLAFCHQYFLNQKPTIVSSLDVQVTILALLLTLAFSTLSYRYMEKPMIEFGRRFVNSLNNSQ